VDLPTYRAASALLLVLPETPLLFMGQEWAASTPFLFFTDHHAALGPLVTQGRRREFQSFSAFSDPEAQATIPDPQARETFDASRLRWDERVTPPHRGIRALYRELLARRQEYAADLTFGSVQAFATDADSLVVTRPGASCTLWLACRLRGRGPVRFGDMPGIPTPSPGRWTALVHTEEERFTADPMPPEIVIKSGAGGSGPCVDFQRPGAALFRWEAHR
jgi:maltooligosyltrehalose trehalohydrolase